MRSRTRRRVRNAVIVTALVVGVGGGAMATWALNRFVIDHVEISDVRAYEASASAAASQTASQAASVSPTASGPTSTPTTAASAASAKAVATPKASATVAVARRTATATATSAPSVTASATPTRTATASSTASPTATKSATPTATATKASAPVITANSYTGNGISIAISKGTTGSGNGKVTYYVADVTLDDATQLRSAFANNEFGTNIIDLPSSIARGSKAVFAINGDYYGFRTDGIVVRNGVVYRDKGVRTGLAFYRDGTVKVYDETKTTGKQLVASGVWNTLSFGPALVIGGEVQAGIDNVEVDTNFGNRTIQGQQPRTLVGIAGNNHLIFVVVDGRQPGYSVGVTMTQAAQLMAQLGCQTAYNIDGGGSATMYFNGADVNLPANPNNRERGTSDILYIAG